MGYDVSPKGAIDVLKDLKESNTALALIVSETDDQKNVHAAFAPKIIGYLETLLSKEKGIQLVIGLANGQQSVTIQPEGATKHASSEACRPVDHKLVEKHQPTGAVVLIDPGMNDQTLICFDQEYNEVFQPPFITLGHELIHALHFTTGTAADEQAEISHPDYHNYEEEQTIASGDPTENMLRVEHNFTPRFGHNGKDQRFPHLINYPDRIPLSDLAQLTEISAHDIIQANHDIFSDPYNSEVRRMLQGTRAQVKMLVSQSVNLQQRVAELADKVLWDRFSSVDFANIDNNLGQSILLAFFTHKDNQDWTDRVMVEGLMNFASFVDNVGDETLGGFVERHQNGQLGAAIRGDADLRRLILGSPAFAEALNEEEEVHDPVVLLLQANAVFTTAYILRTMDMDDLLEALTIPPEDIIRSADPATILCQQLVVPGWYTHYVSQSQLVSEELFKAIEQRYKVSAGKVKAANRHIQWEKLALGMRILIPKA